MESIIITIGDELLIGQVVNTNAVFIAEQFNRIGIGVRRILTVGDNETEILTVFRDFYSNTDIIAVTGGLGPTHDDITRRVVCNFFHRDLVSDSTVREHIARLMEGRGLPWTRAAEAQTFVPRDATIIMNRIGTAPGYLFDSQGTIFIVMPGVPYEMEEMMTDFVLPYLRGRSPRSAIVHRTLKTTGIPESFLAERLGNLDDLLGGATLAFLPSPFGVRLRITATGTDESVVSGIVRTVEERIRNKAGSYIYGTDEEELEEVVGRLLKERRISLAIAESCTGGLVAARMTNVPGSSAYLDRCIVSYSNEAKSDLLDVPPELIKTYGAVSKEVAETMAVGVRARSRTDIGLSVTGIAGPGGATPEKSVGLVWIGYADASEVATRSFRLGNNRQRVRERASQAALEMIRRMLLGIRE